MIFDRHELNLILTGVKTQLRTPARSGEPYTVGRRYPVQRRKDHGPPDPSVGRVVVEDQALEFLGDISAEDLVREGHRDLRAFREWWLRDARRGAFDPERPVWVVTFRLDIEQPVRLLAAGGGLPARKGDEFARDNQAFQAGTFRGYVESRHSALPDEPEAVDDEWLERFAVEARARSESRDRDLRSLEERIAAARAEARALGIDVRRQEARVRAGLEALELQIKRRKRTRTEEAA